MGTILRAICNQCNFERTFNFGGGMLDFETYCGMSAINKKTGGFVVANYFKKEKNKK